jgi:hypothetical protein
LVLGKRAGKAKAGSTSGLVDLALHISARVARHARRGSPVRQLVDCCAMSEELSLVGFALRSIGKLGDALGFPPVLFVVQSRSPVCDDRASAAFVKWANQ